MERSTGYGHGRLLENIQNTLKYMLYSKGHALRRLAHSEKFPIRRRFGTESSSFSPLFGAGLQITLHAALLISVIV
jgi:hypothetical protein